MPANTAAAIARSREFSHYLQRLLTARPEELERLQARLGQPLTRRRWKPSPTGRR